MKMIARMLAAGTAVVLAGLASAAAAQAPTAAEFAERPLLSQATLSPTGRYMAFVVRSGDASALQVRDLETGETTALVASNAAEEFGGTYIDWAYWKTEDRLIVGLSNLEVGRTGNRETGDIHTVRYGRTIHSIARDGQSQINLEAPRAKRGDPGELLALLADDPRHILMTFEDVNGGLDVARVDVVTGASETILDGDRRIRGYTVDRAGDIVARTAMRGTMGNVLVMEARGDDDRWIEMFRLRKDQIRELPDYAFFGPTDKANEVYVGVSSDVEGGDPTAGVHIYDFATRTLGPTLWRNERYDVSGIVVEAASSRFLGGCYVEDVYRCDYVDPVRQATMQDIRLAIGPQYSISITSQAREGTRWLIHASAPNDPGRYFLFDTATNSLTPFTRRFRIPTEALGRTERVDWQAADGQALFGYLTRPAGAEGAAAPLVVMPHGGPEARDAFAWDVWVQFLASRGYQVFQPNFRGSSGLGRAFAEAGYGQWGLLMQDDVTAGVEHLVSSGLADRERVCIVGSSYGGYAALQAGATRPDLYRCVIAASGVSDLMAMMRWVRSEHGGDSDTYEYWLKSIGDPGADRARLEAASPIGRVRDWRPPTLLIHGERDGVVPFEQSERMERALRGAGKDVRLIELENQGHSNWTSAIETRVMEEMEGFLAEHLPVTAAPESPPPPAP